MAPHIAVHVSVEAIVQTANAATVIRGAVAGPMITKAAGPRINAKTGAASYIPYVITATLKRARGKVEPPESDGNCRTASVLQSMTTTSFRMRPASVILAMAVDWDHRQKSSGRPWKSINMSRDRFSNVAAVDALLRHFAS